MHQPLLSVDLTLGRIAVHHLAGATGAYLAGAVFDLTASYLPVFVVGAAMVYLGAGLTWRLGEAGAPARWPT